MELLDKLDAIIWDCELKQRDANLKATNSYRNDLKDIYEIWLSEFLDELEDIEDEGDRREYIVVALLLLGSRLKEIQRIGLLEGFNLGLAGEPPSPGALEELSNYIRTQERYIDESLVPSLEVHFLDKLDELVEIGQEAFEESLARRVARVALYAGAFWTAIQGAQIWLSQPDRKCTWHLYPLADHCADCPKLAGEWTVSTLPTLPGVDVECDGNCRCWITWETPLEIWP